MFSRGGIGDRGASGRQNVVKIRAGAAETHGAGLELRRFPRSIANGNG